jgi:hypothetical protein
VEKTRRGIEGRVPPIRFHSRNLRFVFFFHSRELVCYRKDLKEFTEADRHEADEVLDLLASEPAGFA